MSGSATPWIIAYQASPSMGFSRQEYWSGLPLPSPKQNARLLQISSTHLRKWLSFKIASSYFCCTNKRHMKRHLLSQPSLILFPILHLCHHGTSAQHHPIIHPFFKIPASQWHRSIPFSTPLTDPGIQKAFNNACGIEFSVQ